MNKTQLRQHMLAKRREMPEDARAQACGYLCEKLLSIPLPLHAVVAGYKAIKEEVNISQALIACHDKKYQVCLPSVTEPERIMHFLSWRPKMPLKKGARGTWEPDGGEVVMPTVVWLPLLGFDRQGYRLGYGGGYYDATIAHLRKRNPSLLTVGIAYSVQEIDSIPHEPHDQRVDMVVTEKEVIGIS